MESLEKKNKELIIHKEKIDKENQRLKDENENLKLQVQYLSETINKMNTLLNESQNKSIEQIQAQIQAQSQLQLPNNILLNNQNVYASPISPLSLIENNFTSDINSPESLTNVSFSSPLFNTDNQVISSTSTDFINNVIPDTNVNTTVSGVTTLSPQSSVGEPAVLTNENSLQRTLFCQRLMQQILQTVILTRSLTIYLMMTLASILQTSAYRPLNNNNYKNLYQKKNYIKEVPISSLKPQLLTQRHQSHSCHQNKSSNYWNNRSHYIKDKKR